MLLASFTVAILGAILASQARSPLVFILAISMVYVNNAIYHPASYSFTANAFTTMDRPKALGLHGAGGTLGHSIGPLSVSILIGMLAFGWRQVYLILILPILIGVVMVFFLKEEEDTPNEVNVPKVVDENLSDQVRSLLSRSMIMFLLFRTLTSLGRSMVSSFFVLYMQDIRGLSLTLASFIFSSTTLSGLVAAPLGGFMASRFGEKKWLIYMSAIGYSSFGLSLFTENMILFIFLFLLYGFCNTVAMASRTSILAKLTPGGGRGLGYSLFFLPTSIIGAVAPVVAGVIAEHYGFNIVFYISLGAYALAWAIMKFMVKVD